RRVKAIRLPRADLEVAPRWSDFRPVAARLEEGNQLVRVEWRQQGEPTYRYNRGILKNFLALAWRRPSAIAGFVKRFVERHGPLGLDPIGLPRDAPPWHNESDSVEVPSIWDADAEPVAAYRYYAELAGALLSLAIALREGDNRVSTEDLVV